MTKDGAQLVGSKTLAQLFGVTVRRVQQLTEEGIISPASASGRARKYDLFETVSSYISYLSDKAYNREDKQQSGDLLEQKLEAEVRLKNAQATKAQMELKELSGELYRAEDIEHLTTELVYSVRGMLLALPSRVCIDAAGLKTPAEVNTYLTKEINNLLNDLAKHEYSRTAYMQLVRERTGLGKDKEGEEDEDDDDEEDY